ncbi:MAG: hypothetical protein M5U19_21775 [Microthrixaceae bacterium]|nr:hypothetical protein [Microthrixaceae bacterium]
MPAKPAPWYELASVAPLAATAYLGLGPFRGYVEVTGDLRRLRRLGKSQDSTYMAANCAGVVGTQLLAVLSLHGGSVSSEVLASETAGLAPEQLDAELDRLVRAGLVEGVGKGGCG